MMMRYQYDPLPGEAYVRLVTLHPGRFNDAVVISFHTSPFSSDDPPPYEALSYTWGSGKRHWPIYVTDLLTTTATLWNVVRAKFKRVISQQNLGIALKHLRYVDKPRVMWIDALCINQADEVEKGSQVARMSEIYRLAHRVVAWIGPEENDSDHAMEWMDLLSSQVEVDFSKFELSPAKNCTDPTIGNVAVPLDFDARSAVSVCHLLSRQWFSRLWVQQEVALANSEAIIKCGFYQVKWHNFKRALACLYLKSKSSTVAREQFNLDLMSLTGFFRGTTQNSIINLRENFGKSHCMDPRDRLYAVSALLPEIERAFVLPPDYTKSYAVIYTHVVTEFIKTYRGLNILTKCELRDNSPCPSWVPDWSDCFAWDHRIAGVHIQASSQLGPSYEFPEHEVLRVMGMSKAEIRECHQVPIVGDADPHMALKTLRTLASKLGVGEQTTLEDFARTVVEDALADNYDVQSDIYLDIDEAKDVISLIMSGHQFKDDDFIWPSACTKLLRWARLSGAPYFQTTSGSTGIAPRAARPGDEICVILGCALPLLLRPLGNGKFKLVGPCFMVGLMHGEAFLGPLPKNIRMVEAFDNDTSRLTFWFKDVISGELFYEDPRLKSLPLDIDPFRSYLSQHHSAVLATDPEALQECGIGLKQIDLI
ncbi:HET-domain-containing protein [Annulohypoxylon truncatum]|uniref:HET-domain-containing protein n=1 Tax=Annulohypoxylon truncatum TaxID=327061 RepID=UPI002007BBF1|nr:HET-domain-containing protein [Annulohypoxylon truncatum]KAI1212289.1 HET-domain-containing protein [Annulohypoxylon truncatum]